jgi:hypothetical protein
MQVVSVFQEALHLSPLDKVRLLDLLMASFTHQKPEGHEQAWESYAEMVCDQVDAGMPLHNLDTVIAELNR